MTESAKVEFYDSAASATSPEVGVHPGLTTAAGIPDLVKFRMPKNSATRVRPSKERGRLNHSSRESRFGQISLAQPLPHPRASLKRKGESLTTAAGTSDLVKFRLPKRSATRGPPSKERGRLNHSSWDPRFGQISFARMLRHPLLSSEERGKA